MQTHLVFYKQLGLGLSALKGGYIFKVFGVLSGLMVA